MCEGHPKNLGKASNWLAEAAITEEGTFVYAICRVAMSLVYFSVNQETGMLTLSGRHSLDVNSNARNLTIDGSNILVASQDAD